MSRGHYCTYDVPAIVRFPISYLKVWPSKENRRDPRPRLAPVINSGFTFLSIKLRAEKEWWRENAGCIKPFGAEWMLLNPTKHFTVYENTKQLKSKETNMFFYELIIRYTDILFPWKFWQGDASPKCIWFNKVWQYLWPKSVAHSPYRTKYFAILKPPIPRLFAKGLCSSEMSILRLSNNEVFDRIALKRHVSRLLNSFSTGRKITNSLCSCFSLKPTADKTYAKVVPSKYTNNIKFIYFPTISTLVFL